MCGSGHRDIPARATVRGSPGREEGCGGLQMAGMASGGEVGVQEEWVGFPEEGGAWVPHDGAPHVEGAPEDAVVGLRSRSRCSRGC